MKAQMNVGFAVCLGIPCCISALYGSYYINEYVNRTKKSAWLLFALLYMTIISTGLLIGKTVLEVYSDLGKAKNVLEFQNFCYLH
jgi:hypothetical protein